MGRNLPVLATNGQRITRFPIPQIRLRTIAEYSAVQYTGPIPVLSAILPASSSLACRRTAAPCQPGRNGSMKSNTTAFRDGDRVRVSSQRGNDYTDGVRLDRLRLHLRRRGSWNGEAALRARPADEARQHARLSLQTEFERATITTANIASIAASSRNNPEITQSSYEKLIPIEQSNLRSIPINW